MPIRFDEWYETLGNAVPQLPLNGPPRGARQTTPVNAGYGSCKSCSCTGYQPKGKGYCTCGHNFVQHR